jgi:hypothetical protein
MSMGPIFEGTCIFTLVIFEELYPEILGSLAFIQPAQKAPAKSETHIMIDFFILAPLLLSSWIPF